MIHVKAFFKGKLITDEVCPDTVKTEKEAKERIINTLYWNHIPCTMASEPKWWNKFDIQTVLI